MAISEESAREALARAKSPAANSDTYDAERRERGWLFGWSADPDDMLVGTICWAVADNGRVRGVHPALDVDEVLDELMDDSG